MSIDLDEADRVPARERVAVLGQRIHRETEVREGARVLVALRVAEMELYERIPAIRNAENHETDIATSWLLMQALGCRKQLGRFRCER
jgi:hypothetical protein